MAAGVLPKPGTRSGPCAKRCAHRDCAATRADSEEPCDFCRKPIGYGVRYYRIGGGAALAHALCAEVDAEFGPMEPSRCEAIAAHAARLRALIPHEAAEAAQVALET